MDPIEEYEPATKQATAVMLGLERVSDKLGNPTDCSTNSGWVMFDSIIEVWKRFWPQEVEDWKKQLKHDLSVERTAHEAKEMGYFPVSYPTRIFKLTKTLLPDQKMNDRKFLKGIVTRYPFLQASNYKI